MSPSLIAMLLIAGLFVLTGCGNSDNNENVINSSENKEEISDDFQENNKFILKDHKGYYNETKDKYIVEGTIVNKTDTTFENQIIMIKALFADGSYAYFATCTIDKIEPNGEIKIVAET